jgi:hypothetical protein
MHDDIQVNSPTTSDTVRPSPTLSDHVRPSPTLSATRSDAHTLTTNEVAKIFEESGLPRDKRSIERYCEQGKLDCFKDPDEIRYFITHDSARRLIGHLSELKQRHQQSSIPAAPMSGATNETVVGQRATTEQAAADVKRGPDDKHMSDGDREAYEKKMKDLQDQIFNLEVDKRAKDQVVTMLRDQLKDDRDHYSDKLTKYGRRLGQLETQVKQLTAPNRTATSDDTNDDDAAIDAEFSEPSTASDSEFAPV